MNLSESALWALLLGFTIIAFWQVLKALRALRDADAQFWAEERRRREGGGR